MIAATGIDIQTLQVLCGTGVSEVVRSAQYSGALPAGRSTGMTGLASLPEFQNPHVWQQQLRKNLGNILALQPGWDGPRSKAVERDLLHRANILIADSLNHTPNAQAPFVVPLASGGVQIEWHAKAGELELEAHPNGDVSIWVRDRSSGHEFEGDGKEAFGLFARWAPRLAAIDNDAVHVPGAPADAIQQVAA